MATSLYCRKCGTRLAIDTQFCPTCGISQVAAAQSPTHRQSAVPSPFGTGMSPAGSVLNQRYRLLKIVGRGGMGAVYLAQDIQLGDRLVALKEMRVEGFSPQDLSVVIGQFRREAHLLASLHHPHLPAIHEYFTENGRWYLVMSFIEGQTLQAALNTLPGKRLPVNEVVRIGLELCDVLEYLHTHEPPIIFRDLKPLNIMMTPKGHVCLIDFGIARHFKQEQANDTTHFYSVGYAPPEQYGQSQTGPRSDIYSLGATFHQMLSGLSPSQHPFQFPALQQVDPTIPAPLARLVMQMVEMNEQARPASVAEIKWKLEQVLTMGQSSGSIGRVRIESANTVEVGGRPWSQPMPVSTLHTSQTTNSSEMLPPSMQSWQEERAKGQPLARRSILIGLLGGIVAVGGGAFVLNRTLLNHPLVNAVPVPTKSSMGQTPVQVSKPTPTTTTAGSSSHWTNFQQITTESGQTNPAIAASSNGMLNMVFPANNSGNGLLYISSKDNGTTWSNNYSIPGQSSKSAPSLCIAQDGTLCVAYEASAADNSLWYTSSKDNGTTWHNAILVLGQSSKASPSLSIAQDGTLYMAYLANGADNSLWYTSSKDNGATWGNTAMVPGQTSRTAPALALAANGMMHLAFVANNVGNGLLYASSKDNGTAWSDNYPIPGQSSLLAPALAVLDTTLYLAFVTSDGSNLICVVSSQDGIHWSDRQEIGHSSLQAPSLTVVNNTLYLAFSANDGSNQPCVISSKV